MIFPFCKIMRFRYLALASFEIFKVINTRTYCIGKIIKNILLKSIDLFVLKYLSLYFVKTNLQEEVQICLFSICICVCIYCGNSSVCKQIQSI